MAQGSIALATSSTWRVTGEIKWWSTKYDSGNYSLVDIEIWVYMNRYGIDGTGSGTFDVNGSLDRQYSPYCNVGYGGSGDVKVCTRTGIRVNHDSNGNGSVTLGAWMDFSFAGVYNLTGSGVAYMDHIDRHPTLDLNEVSKTATSITVKATSNNGITPTKYYFTCGNSTKETTSNQVTFDNLTPNTPYTIKCKGYANGDYGSEATTSITTNRQNSISNIGDFTLDGVTFTITGNPNDTSTIKILVGNTVVATRNNVGVGQYTLTLTDAEKETIYRLMGNNSSIGAVIRIDTGGATLDYNKNITLTGDVFSCSINVGGTIKKGKVWVGTPSGNKQGIFTIGTSNGNKRGR